MWRRVKLLPSVIFLTGTSKWCVSAACFSARRMSRRQSLLRRCSTDGDEKAVQDMLYRIQKVNFMPKEVESTLLDFSVDGIQLGEVTPKTAETLVNVFPDNPVFEYKHHDASKKSFLSLSDAAGNNCESRTAAVQSVMEALRDRNVIHGWRNELYPISRGFYEEPIFNLERAATPLLGTVDYGVHINGLVSDENGDVRMWMARRSRTKSKYPGMLDHIVAGGQPTGMSLLDNVVKECMEEAGIPENITRARIQASGAISYRGYVPEKDAVTRAVLFCFDLQLPPDFLPQAVDGEVEEFFLWDMRQVKASMAPDFDDPIKPNCYLVITDYMVRCGHVSPEAPGYLDVVKDLRSGDCY